MHADTISFLPNVYGLWRIKEELKVIHDWYKDPNMAGARQSLLPHGILFYGNPGVGKTFLMREYSRTFDCPIYVIQGDAEEVQEEVLQTYEKASKDEMAIIIVDEIDCLIHKDEKLTRIFQSTLDGFKEHPGVLTLATANDVDEIPEPLKREGRFDRRFNVCFYEQEEVTEAILGFLRQAGIASIEKEELENMIECFRYRSPSHIRSSINMAALRYGEKCTADQIIDSSYFLATGLLPSQEGLEIPWRHAVHEAGHAVFAHFFSECFYAAKVQFYPSGGNTITRPLEETDSVKKISEDIRISLSGLIAEELVFGKHDFGCDHDLDHVHYAAERLVNRQGLVKADQYCARYDRRATQVSQRELMHFEASAKKFIRKQYRITKRLLRKRKQEILHLASFLQKNKQASWKEITELMG